MTVAHVVTQRSGAGAPAWLAAAAAIAGVIAAAFGPRRSRRPAAALAAAGLATVVTFAVIAPGPPAPPAYRLTILPAAGSRVTSPLPLVACGRDPQGSTAAVPGADRVLSVSVDGREVLATTGPTALLLVPLGLHQLRAEVLTRDHVEYQPALAVESPVTVTGTAAAGHFPACP